MIPDYWKRYFHDIELKTTLNPYFVWNIPKTAYQLSRSLRAKGAPYILDPLYWFCMFIIKNKDDIPQFIGMSIYETDETMCAAIVVIFPLLLAITFCTSSTTSPSRLSSHGRTKSGLETTTA